LYFSKFEMEDEIIDRLFGDLDEGFGFGVWERGLFGVVGKGG
jgi:hypothetical protein